MLVKILIFVGVIFLVYIFFFKNKRKEEIQKHKKEEKKTLEGDTMLECVQCGTFVTDKDSIIKDGRFFCSKECAGILR